MKLRFMLHILVINKFYREIKVKRLSKVLNKFLYGVA